MCNNYFVPSNPSDINSLEEKVQILSRVGTDFEKEINEMEATKQV